MLPSWSHPTARLANASPTATASGRRAWRAGMRVNWICRHWPSALGRVTARCMTILSPACGARNVVRSGSRSRLCRPMCPPGEGLLDRPPRHALITHAAVRLSPPAIRWAELAYPPKPEMKPKPAREGERAFKRERRLRESRHTAIVPTLVRREFTFCSRMSAASRMQRLDCKQIFGWGGRIRTSAWGNQNPCADFHKVLFHFTFHQQSPFTVPAIVRAGWLRT